MDTEQKGLKIMVVLPRFPYPLEKGDKLRAYHQIVELAKKNDVYLFCVSHERVEQWQIEAMRPYCREVVVAKESNVVGAMRVVRNWVSAKSLQMGYWTGKKSKRACRQMAKRVQPDVIYSQMVRTMPLVARLSQAKVMDYQDALSMNTERRMEQSRWPWRYVLHYEFKMLRSSEYNAFKIFDKLTIISETDRDAIPHRNGHTICIVRNGVDTDYFAPMEREKRYDVVFCGNMQYQPNVDAAHYLVEEVMPIVWQQRPEATVMLAGATPKQSVRRLASERVMVSGTVDDIRPYYADARLCIAPMRLGSGLQNKLLEAMSMGIPCVTTPLAWEALQGACVDGMRADSEAVVRLGANAQELAEQILLLLGNEELRQAMATSGREAVERIFSWQSTGRELERVLHEAVAVHKQMQDGSVEDK